MFQLPLIAVAPGTPQDWPVTSMDEVGATKVPAMPCSVPPVRYSDGESVTTPVVPPVATPVQTSVRGRNQPTATVIDRASNSRRTRICYARRRIVERRRGRQDAQVDVTQRTRSRAIVYQPGNRAASDIAAGRIGRRGGRREHSAGNCPRIAQRRRAYRPAGYGPQIGDRLRRSHVRHDAGRVIRYRVARMSGAERAERPAVHQVVIRRHARSAVESGRVVVKCR